MAVDRLAPAPAGAACTGQEREPILAFDDTAAGRKPACRPVPILDLRHRTGLAPGGAGRPGMGRRPRHAVQALGLRGPLARVDLGKLAKTTVEAGRQALVSTPVVVDPDKRMEPIARPRAASSVHRDSRGPLARPGTRTTGKDRSRTKRPVQSSRRPRRPMRYAQRHRGPRHGRVDRLPVARLSGAGAARSEPHHGHAGGPCGSGSGCRAVGVAILRHAERRLETESRSSGSTAARQPWAEPAVQASARRMTAAPPSAAAQA